MFVSLILSLLARKHAFVWRPSLDLTDHEVYSTLLPGAHH